MNLQSPQLAPLRPELVLQVGHTEYVIALAVSPNGRFIASGGLEGTVKIWDLRSGRLWRTIDGIPGMFHSLAFSPDNRLIAAGGGNAIRLVDVIGGSTVRTLEPCDDLLVHYRSGDVGTIRPSEVTSIAFDPNEGWLASACDGDAAVTLWDITTGVRIRRIPDSPPPAGSHCISGEPPPCRGMSRAFGDADGLTAIAMSADGRRLATGGRDRTIRIWDPATGHQLLERTGHTNAIDSLTFSADSGFLASSDRSTAVLWQLPHGTAVRGTRGHASAISPDQRWLTATADGTINVWNIATGRDEESLPPQDPSETVLSADGRFLITVRRGAPAPVHLATRQATVMLDVAPARWRLALSPDNRWAVLLGTPPESAMAEPLSNDRRTGATLWQMGTDTFLTLPGPAGIGDAVFSASGRVMADISDDRTGAGPTRDSRTIRVWEVPSRRTLATLSSVSTRSIALSPDGRWIAAVGRDTTTAGNGDTLRIWDAATGDLVRAQAGRWRPDVAFSPDSRLLVASSEGTISIQEVESGREVRALYARPPFIFSPDGRSLVTGVILEAQLQVWDLATGRVTRTLPYEWSSAERILAISSNGQWLLTGNWSDGVALWDLTTGRLARSFNAYSAGFSAGGNHVRVTARDGTTRFWDPRDGSLVASLVISEDSNDWVIATTDGRVDGSESGLRKLVAWRVADTVYPADRFLEHYRTPGLLDQVLGGR